MVIFVKLDETGGSDRNDKRDRSPRRTTRLKMDRIKFAQLTQRITNLGVEAQTLSFTKKDNTLGRKMDQSKNNRSREINNTKLFFLLIHN
jgi:hypothetical protein